MASRVQRVAVVAGLVALGVADGTDARAEAPGTAPLTAAPPNPPARRTTAKKAAAKARARSEAGLVATLPGFEMLPDGGSRLFVALTHSANVTEKRDARVLTYIIQGAHVVHRNNENALETMHFNTPVSRARLFPVGNSLAFTVDLRAETPAVWRMVDGGDGSFLLQIDFPRGAFLPAGEWAGDFADDVPSRPRNATLHTPPAVAAPAAPASAPAPPAAAPPGPPADAPSGSSSGT